MTSRPQDEKAQQFQHKDKCIKSSCNKQDFRTKEKIKVYFGYYLSKTAKKNEYAKEIII